MCVVVVVYEGNNKRKKETDQQKEREREKENERNNLSEPSEKKGKHQATCYSIRSITLVYRGSPPNRRSHSLEEQKRKRTEDTKHTCKAVHLIVISSSHGGSGRINGGEKARPGRRRMHRAREGKRKEDEQARGWGRGTESRTSERKCSSMATLLLL